MRAVFVGINIQDFLAKYTFYISSRVPRQMIFGFHFSLKCVFKGFCHVEVKSDIL